MASSTIDVLLQATGTPRAGDAAPRAGDDATPFQPALEQALAEQPPAAATTDAARDEYEPPAKLGDVHDQSHDASGEFDEPSADVEASPAVSADDDAASDKGPTLDAVEISEAAVVAAAATPATNGAHRTTAEQAARLVEVCAAEAASGAAGTRQSTADGAGDPAGSDTPAAAGAGRKLGPQPVNDLTPALPGEAANDETARRGAKTKSSAEPAKASQTAAAANGTTLELLAGGDEEAEATGTGDATADALSDQLEQDARPDADEGTREAKRQAAGARVGAPPTDAAVTAAAVAGTAAAEAAEKVASPSNDQAAGDGVAKPATAQATAAAARTSASLERLTVARGLRPGGTAGETDSTPQVDPARFVSRVEGAMRAAHQRDGRVQVRLSPPELGSLRIELHMQNGALTAHVETETASARKLLLDNLPALRDRLAQQDIRVEKFDVDVRRDGAGQSGGGGPQDRSADQPARQAHDQRSRPASSRPTPAPTARPIATTAATISDAGLDVRV